MKNKPIYLWPFIVIYKLVLMIIKLPITIIHYFSIGIFFSLYTIIDVFVTIGMYISYAWWKFLKYFSYGISAPFVLISRTTSKSDKVNDGNAKSAKKNKQTQFDIVMKELREREAAKKANEELEVLNNKKVLEQEEQTISNDFVDKENKKKRKLTRSEKRAEKLRIKEEKRKRKEEAILAKKKKKENDSYVNENVTIEKETLGTKINNFLEKIVNFQKRSAEKSKKSSLTSSFKKNKNNVDLMKREALLINFEGEDAQKSNKKVVYEYVGKNAEGKLVKDYFEAFSKVEVHSFLLSEGYEVYSIKTNSLIQFLHGGGQRSMGKFKVKDLIFFLTQLSTYIKAGIPLVESLRILSKQFKNKNYQKIFRAMIYDLTMGDNFSIAMEKQGTVFPKLLINMLKAAEMTGELPETLDDMTVYYEESDKTRKQMITALSYPAIIFVLAIAALSFIMIYIVPKFVEIYASMDNATIPWITQLILDTSAFLRKDWIFLLLGVAAVIAIFVYLYKNVKLFRTGIQWFLMKLPIIGNVIIFNEVTMFTKTFASLLKHNVFITDTMEILNKITNNEIWKMIILDTITNLAKGEKISLAFQDHWAVPVPAYEMIVTGERTGQLPEMMQKVSDYYQELHKNAVGRIKAFVEPILIICLTFAVGVIVLSIVIPMFDMYSQLN